MSHDKAENVFKEFTVSLNYDELQWFKYVFYSYVVKNPDADPKIHELMTKIIKSADVVYKK